MRMPRYMVTEQQDNDKGSKTQKYTAEKLVDAPAKLW